MADKPEDTGKLDAQVADIQQQMVANLDRSPEDLDRQDDAHERRLALVTPSSRVKKRKLTVKRD